MTGNSWKIMFCCVEFDWKRFIDLLIYLIYFIDLIIYCFGIEHHYQHGLFYSKVLHILATSV